MWTRTEKCLFPFLKTQSQGALAQSKEIWKFRKICHILQTLRFFDAVDSRGIEVQTSASLPSGNYSLPSLSPSLLQSILSVHLNRRLMTSQALIPNHDPLPQTFVTLLIVLLSLLFLQARFWTWRPPANLAGDMIALRTASGSNPCLFSALLQCVTSRIGSLDSLFCLCMWSRIS